MLIIEPVTSGYQIQYVKNLGDQPEWTVVARTPAHIKLVTDHEFTNSHAGSTSNQCPLCVKERREQERDTQNNN